METVPIQVRRITVEGNDHTALGFLKRELDPLKDVTNVEALNGALHKAIANLHATNLYSSVAMNVDAIPELGQGQVNVLVKLKEKMRYGTQVGMNQTMDGQAATGSLTANVRNTFGHGETFSVSIGSEADASALKNVTATLRGVKPFASSNATASVSAFRDRADWSGVASFVGSSQGLVLGLSSAVPRHRVEYEVAFREVAPVVRASEDHVVTAAEAKGTGALPRNAGPSAAVLYEALMPSVKSALRYVFRSDSRGHLPPAPTSSSSSSSSSSADGQSESKKEQAQMIQAIAASGTPNHGRLLQAKIEAAGLGGDVAFVKAEGLVQQYLPVGPKASLGLSLRGGWAGAWATLLGGSASSVSRSGADSSASAAAAAAAAEAAGAAAGAADAAAAPAGAAGLPVKLPTVPIMDRFFQNPLFVRGMSSHSLGPNQGKDALGGDVYVAAAASLQTSIPRYEDLPLKPHVFANVGVVRSIERSGFALSDLVSAAKASVGFGFVLPTPAARVELNMAFPYVNGELARGAFSIGGGMEW